MYRFIKPWPCYFWLVGGVGAELCSLLLRGSLYFRGRGRVATFGGLLLSGFTRINGFFTLFSGGRYFRGVVTIGSLRY